MTTPTRIVAGVAAGETAPLIWAFTEAARRSAELDVVHAWSVPPEVSPLGIPGPALDIAPYAAEARHVVEEAIASVPSELRAAVRAVRSMPTRERASLALIAASDTADLLVVGARRHGAIGGLLGSVSHKCVHHARCSVATVPPLWPAQRRPRHILVGVDSSEGSALALWWALAEAARWDSRLTLVHSWSQALPIDVWGVGAALLDREVTQKNARASMETMLDDAVRQGAAPPRDATVVTVEESAGPALVRMADHADLLVVGSRGRSEFAALLLGSTSQFCVNHSAIPVVVVPPASANLVHRG